MAAKSRLEGRVPPLFGAASGGPLRFLGGLLFGKDLQYIRVSADRAVLKRGKTELMLSGEGAHSILEALMEMLDGSHSRAEIVSSFPENQQEEIDALLTGLLQRRLITDQPEPDAGVFSLDSLQVNFWRNFGEPAKEARERLRNASFVVVGANLITRALVRSLLEMGAGGVTLVGHSILNNESAPVKEESIADPRLSHVPELPPDAELTNTALICAASDFGSTDALLEINRAALRVQKPYFPLWLSDLVGYVGPLTWPRESACLRCFHARVESNNPDWAAARAVQRHMSSLGPHCAGVGLLPPMASILGEIGAMEMTKFIAGFPPPDTVGRIIEINLVSWASTVRRVLKIPRCPDCSEMMKKATRAITLGALIPYSEE
jgi:bacteriocin biosynthesis cyclodehydratase domain-containing protein